MIQIIVAYYSHIQLFNALLLEERDDDGAAGIEAIRVVNARVIDQAVCFCLYYHRQTLPDIQQMDFKAFDRN